MSDGQRSRRRFLADLLFLGGALGAGAFIVKATGDDPAAIPDATCSPTGGCPVDSSPTPNSQCTPMVKGDSVAPPPPPPGPPHLGGKAAPPMPPQIDGEVAPARPSAKGKFYVPPTPGKGK